MSDLARRIKVQTASTSEIVWIPYDVAYARGFEDMQRRVPDLSKLERLVGDRPRTSLEQILTAVVGDARARRQRRDAGRATAAGAEMRPSRPS